MGILLAVILGLCILGGDSNEKLLDEYCNLECKKNMLDSQKFCC